MSQVATMAIRLIALKLACRKWRIKVLLCAARTFGFTNPSLQYWKVKSVVVGGFVQEAMARLVQGFVFKGFRPDRRGIIFENNWKRWQHISLWKILFSFYLLQAFCHSSDQPADLQICLGSKTCACNFRRPPDQSNAHWTKNKTLRHR